MEKTDIIDEKIATVEADLSKFGFLLKRISEKFDSLTNKPKLEPLDLDGNGVIDERERQIYDYYNKAMEKMQSHYILGRLMDILFTLGLVLFSTFVL